VLENAEAPAEVSNSSATATHKVAPGESASVIADKYGISLADFLAWNNLSKSDIVKVGQVCVVGRGSSAPSSPAITATPEPISVAHVVAKGESPWTIASKYGMDLGDLLALNGLSKDAVLRTGQSLKVTGAASATGTSLPSPAMRHTVTSGESPWTIAQKYGVELGDLLAANGLSKNSVVKAGQELTIPSGDSGSTSTKTIVHKTTAGQSPSTIAKKYGVSTSDLFQWNNWSKSHVLQIGEEVTIQAK
jgi:LysM repeat protein